MACFIPQLQNYEQRQSSITQFFWQILFFWCSDTRQDIIFTQCSWDGTMASMGKKPDLAGSDIWSATAFKLQFLVTGAVLWVHYTLEHETLVDIIVEFHGYIFFKIKSSCHLFIYHWIIQLHHKFTSYM